jgi:transmembrane sensor
MTDSSKPLSEVLEQAVVWHTRLTSGEDIEGDWDEFTKWLEAGPENRLAYERVEEFSSSLSTAKFSELAERRETGDRQFRRVPVFLRPQVWLPLAAGLAAVIAFIVANVNRAPSIHRVQYSTHIGQTLTVWLADGSSADLNTATTLRVRIAEGVRQVELLRGEALFHVAQGRARPFDVLLEGRMVRAIGTVFDVVRTPSRLTVTVAEGRVRFSSREARQAVLLAAGDQLVAVPNRHLLLRHVDPSVASDWRRGYLVYQNSTLAEIVDDLNRYFPRKVTVVDAAAKEQKFSGVLRMDQESAVLGRLSRLLPVEVDYRGEGILLRSAKRKD